MTMDYRVFATFFAGVLIGLLFGPLSQIGRGAETSELTTEQMLQVMSAYCGNDGCQ